MATDKPVDQNWQRASEQFAARLLGAPATSGGLNRNSGTWLTFDRLGASRPYRKTITFPGDYITGWQRGISVCPLGRNGVPFHIDLGISGFLGRDDALKLYEMAYFAEGDVLELGTNEGLSTYIMASALQARGGGKIETVDLEIGYSSKAQTNIADRGLSDFVKFNIGDATAFLDQLIADGRTFGFAFVDHWHGYRATVEAAERLDRVLVPGGFVLFHDFNDPTNKDPAHAHGVYPAVLDTLCIAENFEFFGIFGCTGLFRKVGK